MSTSNHGIDVSRLRQEGGDHSVDRRVIAHVSPQRPRLPPHAPHLGDDLLQLLIVVPVIHPDSGSLARKGQGDAPTDPSCAARH